MKHIELKEANGSAPQLCQCCGGPIRLIASEPHPVETDTDVLTYWCTACDEYFVFPPLAEARDARGEARHMDETAPMSIIDLFRVTAFDPEALNVLCQTYDQARRSLHDNGQPHIVNEVIAQRIIALAEKGERDPDRLCAGALTPLGDKAH
jgi:hypothetical protein